MDYICRYSHRWFLVRGEENGMDLSIVDIKDMFRDIINDIHNYRDLVLNNLMSFEIAVGMITGCDTTNHAAHRFEIWNVNFVNAQWKKL